MRPGNLGHKEQVPCSCWQIPPAIRLLAAAMLLTSLLSASGCCGLKTSQDARTFALRSILPATKTPTAPEKDSLFVAEWSAAEKDLAQGHAAQACERLRKLAGRYPAEVELQLFLADALLAAGRPAEALEVLRPLETRFAGDARLQHLLGLAYEHLGLIPQALAHHERAVLLEPGNEIYLACYETLMGEEVAIRQQPMATTRR